MNRVVAGVSLTAALVSLVLHATPVAAQFIPDPGAPSQGDASEAAAHLALTTTHVGALAPMSEVAGIQGTAGRVQIHGQLGFVEMEGPFSQRNFALAITFPRQVIGVRLTGGIADFACDEEGLFEPGSGITFDCGLGFFGGLDGTIPLIRPALAGPNGAAMSASLVVSLGASTNDIADIDFEDPTDPFFNGRADLSATTYSAAVGIPLSLVVQSEDITVVPHLTPRIGYGRSTSKIDAEFAGDREQMEDTDGGVRPMLGAGVDILFGKSGFGLGLGMQKVFAEDSEMLVGINLSFRRR